MGECNIILVQSLFSCVYADFGVVKDVLFEFMYPVSASLLPCVSSSTLVLNLLYCSLLACHFPSTPAFEFQYRLSNQCRRFECMILVWIWMSFYVNLLLAELFGWQWSNLYAA
jgi:hypothetical protein